MADTKDQDLRERLLETARKLLIEKGYRGFSLREVARNTGVSATSVYLCFENKDDLIHTLMEQSIDELNERLQEVYVDYEDPLRRLEAFARTYVDYALEHPREYQIIYVVSSDEMSRYPRDKFRKARRSYELLTATIREGIEKGLLEEPHPRTAAYTFWAQLHGVMSVVLSRRLDTRIDQNEFIKQAISHILHGFQVRTSMRAHKP